MTTPGNTFREIEHARDRLGRWIKMNSPVLILGGSRGEVIGSAPHGRIDVRRADGTIVRVSPGHITVQDEPAVRKVVTGGRGRLAPEKVAGEPEQIDLFAFAESEPTPDPKPADVQPSDAGRAAVADVLAADEDPDDDDAEVTEEDWRRPPTEFEFPAWRLADATAKIDQANRRAERAGIAERFGYTIERFEVTRTTDKDGNRLAFPYIEERIRLTLDRPQVQHDGWTFVATLSWDPEAGLVTRVVPDATLAKRPEARHCDVCNSQRDRKDTYVIQNAEGEEKQVGSNCLQQFMGLRPASLWMLDYSPDMPGDDDEDGGYGGGGGGESRYETLGLLRLALAMVSKRGWVSRGTASVDYTKRATADLMGDYMAGQFHKSKDVGEQQFARELDDLIDDEGPLAEEAVNVRDFARTMDGDSEYVLNLRAVAAADSVSSRNLALLASAVAAKQRHDGYVAERKAKAAATGDSKHQGTVGGKLADIPVKITGTKRIEGDYGVSTLISFIDGEGNVYKWFSSAFDGEFEIGDDVLMSGTVKGHGEFRGVPETSMTRAKLKATGERGAAEAAEEARLKAEAAQAKKMTKVPVPPGYAAYGGEALDLYTVVRIVDEDARTKVKPYIDVTLTQTTQVPGDDSTAGWYVRPTDGRGFRAGVVYPADIVAVRGPEVKALAGEHTDYTPHSEPGRQTPVPPGLARVAMLSDTEEFEVEIPDERYKREGGHDQAFKGLDLFEDDEPGTDPDAPDEEDDREAKTIARGTYVTWGDGGQGTVDLVVLEGRVPGFDASVVATKSEPMARVRLPDGTGFAVEVKRLQPAVPPSPEVKGYAALNALVQEQGLPLGLDAAVMAKAYGRGLKGWPGADVTSLSQHDWAMGRTKALLAARMGEVIPGFADEDLLP